MGDSYQYNEFSRHIYSVTELAYSIKNILEQEFPLIWVKGQINNYTKASSGHVYFTLRDETSSISAVWFKSYQLIDSANFFEGQEVVCAGRISSYPPRGVYQIIVELIQDLGAGKLYLELERLKKKLREKGYFDESHKKAVPKNPKKVAVITSIKGAAIRDFLRIVKEKNMPTHIRIYPSTVQGIEAEDRIVEMIKLVNKEGWADIIVLIRGGGSIEDLHVFNSENIADAIFKSKIPIVTGIGHEIDYTIADLVADVRCATPTHVANFLYDDNLFYAQQIDEYIYNLKKGILNCLNVCNREINYLFNELKSFKLRNYLNSKSELIQNSISNMYHLVITLIESKNNDVNFLCKLLYNIICNIFDSLKDEVDILCNNLGFFMESYLKDIEHKFSNLENQLRLIDPMLPLDKGYSLVFDLNKKLITSVEDAKQKDMLEIMFKDGKIQVVVEK